MQKIILVCGVPGSGKTWVCNQLKDKFLYLPHDYYNEKDYPAGLLEGAKGSDRPVLGDCPFGERLLNEKLNSFGCHVTPIFIVEHPQIVQARYEAREHRPIPKNFLTRASSIVDRAEEWSAPYGTAEHILKMLRELPV